jgi:hypothetical protein
MLLLCCIHCLSYNIQKKPCVTFKQLNHYTDTILYELCKRQTHKKKSSLTLSYLAKPYLMKPNLTLPSHT